MNEMKLLKLIPASNEEEGKVRIQEWVKEKNIEITSSTFGPTKKYMIVFYKTKINK